MSINLCKGIFQGIWGYFKVKKRLKKFCKIFLTNDYAETVFLEFHGLGYKFSLT